MKRVSILLYYYFSALTYCSCKQYKLTLENPIRCKDTVLPYAKFVPFEYNVHFYNSSNGYSVITGNVTVLKDIPAQDKKVTLAIGTENPTGITWMFTMKDMDCKHAMMRAIFTNMGVPLSRCVLKKGVYLVKDLDIDAIDSAVGAVMSRSYGQYITKTVIVDKTHTLFCVIIRVTLQSAKRRLG